MGLRALATAMLLAAVAFAAGCTASPSDAAQGSWVLTSASGADGPLDLVESHPVTLQVGDDTVGGTAACNQYGAGLDRRGGRWNLTELEQTAMACEPLSVMDLEDAYLAALGAATRAAVSGDELTLTGPDGVELVFARTVSG